MNDLKRSLRCLPAAAAALLLALPALAQSPAPRAPRTPANTVNRADTAATTSPRQARRAPDPFTLEFNVSGLYDSNIGHDEAEIAAIGNVVGFEAQYRNLLGSARYTLTGGLAAHSYTQTDRFDRISKLAAGSIEVPLAGGFSAGMNVVLSLGGANEDRVLTDQLMFSPRLYYRFGRGGLVRAYAAHRLRESQGGENATNQYVGLALRTASGNRPYFEASTRFERNDADVELNDFDRQTHSLGAWLPLSRRARAGVGLQYTRQDYGNRLLEEDGATVPFRRDEKWTPELALRWDVLRHIELDLAYEFERRTSTDPGKAYDAHVFELVTRYRW